MLHQNSSGPAPPSPATGPGARPSRPSGPRTRTERRLRGDGPVPPAPRDHPQPEHPTSGRERTASGDGTDPHGRPRPQPPDERRRRLVRRPDLHRLRHLPADGAGDLRPRSPLRQRLRPLPTDRSGGPEARRDGPPVLPGRRDRHPEPTRPRPGPPRPPRGDRPRRVPDRLRVGGQLRRLGLARPATGGRTSSWTPRAPPAPSSGTSTPSAASARCSSPTSTTWPTTPPFTPATAARGSCTAATRGSRSSARSTATIRSRLADDLLAIPVPGHTRGSTALLVADRYLFTGDHLWGEDGALHASRSVCWWSWEAQIRSMERLRDFSFEWVLPGHGAPLHAPPARMRALLEEAIARMR